VRTILDVVEEFFGTKISEVHVDGLSPATMSAFADRINNFYDLRSDEPRDPGEFRVYSGGWIASAATNPEAREILLMTLLYAHRVIVHDPIAEWFDRARTRLKSLPPVRYAHLQVASSEAMLVGTSGFFSDDFDRTRSELRQRLAELVALEPLIRAQIALPVAHLRPWAAAQSAILSSVRHAIRDPDFARIVRNPIDEPAPSTDFSRGLAISAPNAGPVRIGDRDRIDLENPAYYLAKTLAIAAASDATYLPPAATDWALFENRISRAGQEMQSRLKIDLKVIPGLIVTSLPLLNNLDASALVAARSDEEAFEDWRRVLRRAIRAVEAAPHTPDFREAVGDSLVDELDAAAAEIRRTCGKSAVLRSATKSTGITLATGLAAAGGVSAAGFPAEGALIGAGVSASTQWVLKSLFRERPTGAAAFLAHLSRA
jgi:hypothetical protein